MINGRSGGTRGPGPVRGLHSGRGVVSAPWRPGTAHPRLLATAVAHQAQAQYVACIPDAGLFRRHGGLTAHPRLLTIGISRAGRATASSILGGDACNGNARAMVTVLCPLAAARPCCLWRDLVWHRLLSSGGSQISLTPSRLRLSRLCRCWSGRCKCVWVAWPACGVADGCHIILI